MMAQSSVQLQAKLMRDYYKYFSKYAKGKAPAQKIAWVTAFTPVEILEALNISYFYPESYAAVIAASEKEQALLEESDRQALCLDCCSYSCCIEGCLETGAAPRGMPPKPDVLIATNNQCNTLPGWWNILSHRYQVPLIVLDYPGQNFDSMQTYNYVTEQHKDLIHQMEQLSGNTMDYELLASLIENSRKSVAAWNSAVAVFSTHDIPPTLMFDTIAFLITSRCKETTSRLYTLLAEELTQFSPADPSRVPLFWLGYPLWYHPKRYLSELLQDVRICGSNYITWWSIDYHGSNIYEKLYNAYNFTFLNLSTEEKKNRLTACIHKSHARGAIVLHNKSCKCDFVSAKNIDLPQAELEIDMIDRSFLNLEDAKRKLEVLREAICTD